MKAPSKQSDIEVEVIETEDIWAQFGPKLPDQLPSQKTTSTSQTLRRVPAWSIAALLTITLHGLLLGSVLFGSPARKHQLPTTTEGAAASVQNSKATEIVSTLMLIHDHSITSEDQDDSAYALMQPAEKQLNSFPVSNAQTVSAVPQVEIAGSDTGTDTNAPTIEAVGNDEGRAMLFGIYMGQIKARVERAWVYPTTTMATRFECKVQIKQTQRGDVVEVTMQHCSNDPAWQLSLAKAIQAASPLPAPPDQKVFSEIVTLNFEAITAPALTQARSP